jgi:hypothetical protein
MSNYLALYAIEKFYFKISGLMHDLSGKCFTYTQELTIPWMLLTDFVSVDFKLDLFRNSGLERGLLDGCL